MSHFETMAPTGITPRSILKHPCSDATIALELQMLLVTLKLSGRLTDRAKGLLDTLAFPGGLSFLYDDSHAVHPENVLLVPLSELTSHPGWATGAVCSHHLHAGEGITTASAMVWWAALDAAAKRPLLFGMLASADPRSRERRHDHFSRVVMLFRRAWKGIALPLARLTDDLAAGPPCVVVERSTGRVIAAVRPERLPRTFALEELLDRPFREIMPSSDFTSWGRMRLSNRTVGDLSLSIVSFAETERPHPLDHLPGRHLVHKLVNSISTVTAGASHIRELLREQPDSDAREIAEMLLAEADAMTRLAHRLDMLINPPDERPCEMPLTAAIAAAVQGVESTLYRPVRLNTILSDDCDKILCSSEILTCLLESLLLAHLAELPRQADARLEAAVTDEVMRMKITSSAVSDISSPAFHRDWNDYVRAFVARMPMKVELDQIATSTKLISRLAVPVTDRKELCSTPRFP